MPGFSLAALTRSSSVLKRAFALTAIAKSIVATWVIGTKSRAGSYCRVRTVDGSTVIGALGVNSIKEPSRAASFTD